MNLQQLISDYQQQEPTVIAAITREISNFKHGSIEQIIKNYKKNIDQAAAQRRWLAEDRLKELDGSHKKEQQFTANHDALDGALAGCKTGDLSAVQTVHGIGGQTWELFQYLNPYNLCILLNHVEIFEYLLNNGVNYTISPNKKFNSGMVLALSKFFKFNTTHTKEDRTIYKLMLEQILKDIPTASASGELDWVLEAMKLQPNIINLTIPNSADLTVGMQFAIHNNFSALLSIDKLYKINFANQDKNGLTMLDHAVMHGHKALSLWLLNKTNPKLSAIELACIHNKEDEVDSIIATNVQDIFTNNSSPLMWSAMLGHENIVNKLIAKIMSTHIVNTNINVSPNVINNIQSIHNVTITSTNGTITNTNGAVTNGAIPKEAIAHIINIMLITALRHKHFNVATALINLGADITFQDNVMLKIGRNSKNQDIIDFLNKQNIMSKYIKSKSLEIAFYAELALNYFNGTKVEESVTNTNFVYKDLFSNKVHPYPGNKNQTLMEQAAADVLCIFVTSDAETCSDKLAACYAELHKKYNDKILVYAIISIYCREVANINSQRQNAIYLNDGFNLDPKFIIIIENWNKVYTLAELALNIYAQGKNTSNNFKPNVISDADCVNNALTAFYTIDAGKMHPGGANKNRWHMLAAVADVLYFYEEDKNRKISPDKFIALINNEYTAYDAELLKAATTAVISHIFALKDGETDFKNNFINYSKKYISDAKQEIDKSENSFQHKLNTRLLF